MNKIKRFEDILAWQKGRELTKAVYSATSNPPFSRDRVLGVQMRKAAVSVVSNIAEGFERDGRKEFINFLSIAKGSAGEVRAQLYVAYDSGYLCNEELGRALKIAESTSRMISGLIRHLKRSDIAGIKYRKEQGDLLET